MKQIKITSKDGVTLHTANKYVDDDLSITIDESLLGTPEVEYPNEAIKYYKENRNKNYPYFPLPSEMEETQDTIYMLYDASDYMCCLAFSVTFTECVCTIQKYMNTTLVSEYVESVTSGKTKYLQFSEEDEDYSTYNYIVIKLQGSITKHYLNNRPSFNNIIYTQYNSTNLLEVSGKCNSCDIKVVNHTGTEAYRKLEYYSFIGVSSTSTSNLFSNCSSLKAVILDTKNMLDMTGTFYECRSLQTFYFTDTSQATNMYQICYGCSSLKKVSLDTSNVKNLNYSFYNCYALKEFYFTDTSKITSMNSTFYQCKGLKAITLDVSNVIEMDSSFNSCSSLTTLKLLNSNNVTDMSYLLGSCGAIQKISFDASSITKFTNPFGRIQILKIFDVTNIKVSFNLSSATMLSQSELVKILNNLAPVETTQTLTLGSTLLAKLTEEQKAIATNKNWTLA